MRDLDLSDLLGRQPAPVHSDDIARYLQGATVLVTGAGGSIGSEISRQVARYQPKRLLLLDRDETLLHEVAVGPLEGAETVLLDICDRDRLTSCCEQPGPRSSSTRPRNKHVPILERYPAQAANTNVLSTWWLANAAAESGCRHFVHLSTDKAAHPCSIMGATKRAAEHVVVGVGQHYNLPYVAVRFGNVLGSRGSVVPTFLRQILDGGPVTVTSSDMTRYFMTIPEAVSLVLQSGAMADDGRTFLLDMGEPASILGMARQMIRLAGPAAGRGHRDRDHRVRPGERLHEQLHDDAEIHEPADAPVDLRASTEGRARLGRLGLRDGLARTIVSRRRGSAPSPQRHADLVRRGVRALVAGRDRPRPRGGGGPRDRGDGPHLGGSAEELTSQRSGRAGTPATVVSAGTSRTTTAPAPITAPSPTLIPWRTLAPVPTDAPAPRVTLPLTVAPGSTVT